MLAHTALSPRAVADEVDRYIALPGQALAYKTGQLELLRIREEAQRRMGAAFDIRGFHDAILSDGALPLPTLAEVVYAWADDAVAPPARCAVDERIAAASCTPPRQRSAAGARAPTASLANPTATR